MKSKLLQRLLRILIVLLGAGIGAALAALALQLYTLTRPDEPLPLKWVVFAYASVILAGGLVFFILRYPIQKGINGIYSAVERRIEKMPMNQLVSCLTGLLTGLLIAWLLSQIFRTAGSIVTVIISAILFVSFGTLGWSIGWKRSKDFNRFLTHIAESRLTRHEAKVARQRLKLEGTVARKKLLDTSVLIDGRLADVCRTGFVEGELAVPSFVLTELRQVADSQDPTRRVRGKRGLENLENLRALEGIKLVFDETDWPDTQDVDVKLLRLADQLKASVITDDHNLNRIAAVTGIPVLNLNELASVLKSPVMPGDVLQIHIARAGKERGQGVGYLTDGTMVVIDGGSLYMDQDISVTVTGATQTNAGRMVFAKIPEANQI